MNLKVTANKLRVFLFVPHPESSLRHRLVYINSLSDWRRYFQSPTFFSLSIRLNMIGAAHHSTSTHDSYGALYSQSLFLVLYYCVINFNEIQIQMMYDKSEQTCDSNSRRTQVKGVRNMKNKDVIFVKLLLISNHAE
jgi:hypothetical protein